MKWFKSVLGGLALSLPLAAFAAPKVAVLDFELNDLTLLPNTPQEIERNASLKPLLEKALQADGFEIVTIPSATQQQANKSFGYLLDHPDLAANLAQAVGADYVLIGRLHKPSFLFAYFMSKLVAVPDGMWWRSYWQRVKVLVLSSVQKPLKT